MNSETAPSAENPHPFQPTSTQPPLFAVSLSFLGITCFALTTIALHFLQPDLSPLDEAVSFYVHGRSGGLLTLGLISWGIGSFALAVGMNGRLKGPGAQVGLGCLGIWGFCVFLGGVFGADPRGHWNEQASIAGMIHGNAAMIGFMVLPVGALQLSRAFRQDPLWKRFAGLLFFLALATVLCYFFFILSLMPVFLRPGPPILLGLSERILLIAYAAWLATATWGLSQSSKSHPTKPSE